MPKLLNTLRNIVLYIVLAKHDNEQSDLLHRVAEERLLEDLPNYQKVGDLGSNALIIDIVQIGKTCSLKYMLIAHPAGSGEVHNEGVDQSGGLLCGV